MNNIEVVTVIDWKWHRGYPGGDGSSQTVIKNHDELPTADLIRECLVEFWPMPKSGKLLTFKFLPWQTNPRPSEGFIEVSGEDETERPVNVGFEVRTALLIRGSLYELTPLR